MRFTKAGAAVALALLSVPAAAQFSDAYNFLKAVREQDAYKAQTIIRQPGSTVVNTRDSESGDQALHIVTKKRDLFWMRFLLGNGADPNGRDRAGNTAMLIASSMGFGEGVRLLLLVKAQPNLANGSGETPLIKAVQMRDTDTVQALLAAGANPDQPDSIAGLSARDYATQDRRAGAVLKLIENAKAAKPAGTMGPTK